MAIDDADSPRPVLPRVLRLMWGHEEAPRRGPKPTLTITDIAAAAVRVADADGLAAVSMSRVARELGYTTMSLYRYVDSKDDLHVAMLDHAYGPPDLSPPVEGGWREQLAQWARANRDALLRHTWVLQVPVAEPPLGPNQMAWMEAGLQVLAPTGLTEQQKLSSMLLVDVYVRGHTQLTLGVDAPVAGGSQRPVDGYGQRLSQLLDAERFPALSAAVLSGSLDDDDSDFSQDELEFGLTAVLDGIEALVARRSGRRKR